MYWHKKIFLISIFIYSTVIIHAEESAQVFSISLQQAISLALQENEDIKIRKQSVEKMTNTYKEVRAVAFPQLTGDFEWDKYIKSPVLRVDLGDGTMEIPLKQPWEMGAGATFSQILIAFGKINTAIDIARKAIDVEKLMTSATENEIIFAVKQLYYTIIFARESVDIAEQSYENALKNQEALKNRFKDGRTSRMDNVKIAADVARRIPSVLEAKSRLNQLLISFKSLIGVEQTRVVELPDVLKINFPVYAYHEMFQKMLDAEPTISVLRRTIELNKRIVDLKKSDFFPTLSGFASYNYSGNSDKMIPKDAMQSEAIAGIRLNLTIWDSGALAGAYRQSRNTLSIAELEYQKRIKQLDVELSSALADYEALKETFDAHKKAVKLAQESYDIALSSFKTGAASLTQLNDAELMLTGAQLEMLATLYSLNVKIITFEKLMGLKSS